MFCYFLYCNFKHAYYFQDLALEHLQSNRIYKSVTMVYSNIIITVLWPPLWSSGQGSWLQIQKSGFDSRHYQIFWEIVGLERGSLILMSITEELLGRESSGSDLERWEYSRRDSSLWPRGTLYPHKLALTLPTSGGRSIGILSSRTQATEFFITILDIYLKQNALVTGFCLRFKWCLLTCVQSSELVSRALPIGPSWLGTTGKRR
jgi:hypothetical protein